MYDPRAVTRLRTAVRGFQAEGDRDWMKYQALQERIEREAPKAMQAGLSDELYATWQGRGQRDTTGASWKRQQQAGLFEKVDLYAGAGLLGAATDEDAAHAVGMKAEYVKAEVERYMQRNPEASPKVVEDHLGELLWDGETLRNGAMLFRQRLLPRR